MADSKNETTVAITSTQSRWQEIEKSVDSHTMLLSQLAEIAENFQTTDTVFSDFKKAQQTVLGLEEQIVQQRKTVAALQKTIEEAQNREDKSSRGSESLKLEWDTALQQSAAKIHNDLQSTRESLTTELQRHNKHLVTLQQAVDAFRTEKPGHDRALEPLETEIAKLEDSTTRTRNTLQFVKDDLTTKLQQYAENLAALQATVSEIQQKAITESQTPNALEREMSALRQSTAQANNALQSLRGNMASVDSTRTHLQKIRALALGAVLLGCLSLAFSAVSLLR